MIIRLSISSISSRSIRISALISISSTTSILLPDIPYQYKGNPNQKWIIEQQASCYYTIKCQSTGKVLSITNGGTWDGANIEQWDYIGMAYQERSIIPARNNTYKIVNRQTVKCLNVSWGSTSANIEQY